MAKIVPTAKTATYVVYTDTICTVSDFDTGKVLLTATPGNPNFFTAIGAKVALSSSSAVLVKPSFNGALIAVGGSGGGSSSASPSKPFMQAHFLRSSGTQYILTDYIPKEGCEIWVDAKRDAAPNGAMATFGAGKNMPTQIVGTTYDSKDYALYFNTAPASYLTASTARKVWHYKPNGECFVGENRQTVVPQADATADTPLYLFARADLSAAKILIGRIYGARISHDESLLLVPALNVMGVPCMVDTLTQKVYKNAGTGAFEIGFTLEQAGELGNYLPLLGGELTIYLPDGYASDGKWQESKALAEGKGWELTVRTYTPEEAAVPTPYSMRRTREMVWCRVAEDENGEYCDAQNNRVIIEWCVEIVNPHGKTPADYGYERFDSIEQAAEAWGLTQIREEAVDDE